jgi:hypothetical protein
MPRLRKHWCYKCRWPVLKTQYDLTQVAGTYSVTQFRNTEIKQLSPLFFAMLWDIDLICGIWVHSDQLQIKFTFRSGPMIFGIFQIWHTHLWHQHIFDMTYISKHSKKKWWQLFYFGITELGNTICPSHLC